MNSYGEWAARYPHAAADLELMHQADPRPADADGKSEAWSQQHIRMQAARAGWALYRNNVGSLPDRRGVPVRFGLCNDSAKLNRTIKSSDLIGIRPVRVGKRTIGQFVSIECKAPGWHYTGTPREQAQLAWITHINRLGGFATFSTGGLPL